MLKDLPPDARPREKMLARGPAALADTELLALLLRTGVRGTPVMQLARNLLDHFSGLPGLLQASPDELRQVRGLGPAKRAEVCAVLELARRSLSQELAERPVFDSPDRVKQHLRLTLGHLPHEVFAVLFLDAQNRLMRLEEMFRGTLTQISEVYLRKKSAPDLTGLGDLRGRSVLLVVHVRAQMSQFADVAPSPSNLRLEVFDGLLLGGFAQRFLRVPNHRCKSPGGH